MRKGVTRSPQTGGGGMGRGASQELTLAIVGATAIPGGTIPVLREDALEETPAAQVYGKEERRSPHRHRIRRIAITVRRLVGVRPPRHEGRRRREGVTRRGIAIHHAEVILLIAVTGGTVRIVRPIVPTFRRGGRVVGRVSCLG